MQKYWVSSFSANWADEFDLNFFDIYTDTEKNNLNWLGRKFPNAKLDYCFGTNEYWEEDEGFEISVEGIEATEEEIQTLRKFHVGGESLKGRYEDFIWDHMDRKTSEKWFKEYCSLVNVPEEIFQSYDFEFDDSEKY